MQKQQDLYLMIRMSFMMLQVFLDHVICHMIRTKPSITNSPKIFTPVAFPKLVTFRSNTTVARPRFHPDATPPGIHE